MATSRIVAAAAALLPLLPTTAFAQDAAAVRRAAREARAFRKLQLNGEQVRAAVDGLLEDVRWYRSLGAALSAGRAQGKPVLWIQALGDIDGFL